MKALTFASKNCVQERFCLTLLGVHGAWPACQGGKHRLPPNLAKKIRKLRWRTSQMLQAAHTLQAKVGRGLLLAATDFQIDQSQ